MAWEPIRPRGFRNLTIYGIEWTTIPCVAIRKTGFTFNKHFMFNFGIEIPSYIKIFADKEKLILGFKRSDEASGAYRFTATNAKTQKGTALVNCKEIGLLFPKYIGHAYKARLNTESQIIEVELSQDNETK